MINIGTFLSTDPQLTNVELLEMLQFEMTLANFSPVERRVQKRLQIVQQNVYRGPHRFGPQRCTAILLNFYLSKEQNSIQYKYLYGKEPIFHSPRITILNVL